MYKKDPLFGYRFERPELEALAYTHSSCDSEQGDNQRLEFLGDAVLDLIVAEHLYRQFPGVDEGGLDRARAAIVNGQSLAAVAKEIGVDQHIQVSESQRQHHAEPSESMLEDCLEALIGALYLDGGLDAARKFIETAFTQNFAKASPDVDPRNPKSRLQEWTQAHHTGATPEYLLVKSEGPDHQRIYSVSVSLHGKVLGHGTGSSIKTAESAAANEALAQLKRDG